MQLAEASQETLVEKWERFFYDYCKEDIEEVALRYPEEKSVVLDYWTIDTHDPEMAEFLIEHPHQALKNAEEALQKMDMPVDRPIQLHLRIRNLPDIQNIGIRYLRSEHLGMFIGADGLVKKVTEVRPKLQVAAFECLKCGAIIKVPQSGNILSEPMECPESQGGCGRKSSFRLLTEESRFIDSQKLEVQENPENLRGGAQPLRLTIYLEDDIVGDIVPGDRITVNGILHGQQRRRGRMKLTEFNKVMDANAIEQKEQAFEEVKISDEEEQEILDMSTDPLIYNKIRESIAPTIYGLEEEKDALALQLFGGVAKQMPDGTRIRGDMHILLVGDPGTAKSQLLRYMSLLAPRSVYTSGKSSSAAGLTASAVRSDEFGEGRWTLEAGALVLADMGIACVDELDKMEGKDRAAMHQAMEQQEISVAKAGINATLKSRCSLLGAANPKFGRFDEYASISEQINMPPALLSRFDLIFPITDVPNRGRDTELASYILQVHSAGERMEQQHQRGETVEITDKQIEPVINPVLLRKYIAYAKRTVFPVLTEEAMEKLKNYYVDVRARSRESVPFTPRQLEAFVRIAEASARIRLSDTVTVDDAQRAIDIVDHYLEKVSMDQETGELDIDIIQTGVSHSQQDRMRTLNGIIRDIAGRDDYATMDDIIRRAEEEGMTEKTVKDMLAKMRRQGTIYEPRQGKYRLTNE
ncbi:MAG: minichromosome maintenance protein MCM [Candidatus Thermoplasmatota archaeon]|nr:minichromosome maintenance protein MCM [Candidatus Thermoplasmatota archaeon]